MKFVYFLIAKVLPTNSVDRAVRTITKAATLLAAAEDAQNQRVSSLDKQIENLAADRVVARDEAARARRIVDRLQSLTA